MSGWAGWAITIATFLPIVGAAVISVVPSEKERVVRGLGIVFTGAALVVATAILIGFDYGAAGELFDTALSRAALLGTRDQLLLLDWWATAVDREAQTLPPDRRMAVFAQVIDRMEIEVRQDVVQRMLAATTAL